MRLRSYLEQVIGSKTAISLTRVLLTHRGMVFTIRRLAETANVSPSEASLVVKQFEEAGVLKLQPVGRSYLVSLNEHSFVLQRIMVPVIHAESETLDELIRLLKDCFEKKTVIKSVYLFGSVASGEERSDSDIDILVISNNFDEASALVAKAAEKVSLVFNKQLSSLVFSERDVALKKNSELIRSIVANHRLVLGKDLLLK